MSNIKSIIGVVSGLVAPVLVLNDKIVIREITATLTSREIYFSNLNGNNNKLLIYFKNRLWRLDLKDCDEGIWNKMAVIYPHENNDLWELIIKNGGWSQFIFIWYSDFGEQNVRRNIYEFNTPSTMKLFKKIIFKLMKEKIKEERGIE